MIPESVIQWDIICKFSHNVWKDISTKTFPAGNLLKLTFEEQEWILSANLSERHARALLRIEEETLRREALSRIITDNMSAGESESFITDVLMKNSCEMSKNPPKGEKKIAIKDVRIFVNTINKAVDTMRLSGINAISRKNETDEYIEYTVKIPKQAS